MEIETKVEEKKPGKLPIWACVLLYIVTFLICMVVYNTLVEAILSMILGVNARQLGTVGYILLEIVMLMAVLTAAVILLRVERRPFSDLGLAVKGHLKDFGYGALVAVLVYLIGFGISLALGEVVVTDFHFYPLHLFGTFLFYALVALAEEILMRGYILGHLLHTRLNKFVSLFISSTIFSLFHIFNPNVALLPMLNLVLAGMMLGASYLYTRNLCFPISLHLFWNWIQGPILGYQVSGNTFSSPFLTLHLPQENVLNGGAFGFEGSLICTVLMIFFTLMIIWWGEKRDAINLVAPRSC